MGSKLERHHILFNRRSWSTLGELAALRGNPRLIVPLESDIHRELHNEISHVPILSSQTARASLSLFEDYSTTNDYIRSVEQLQSSIEQAIKHPRADYLERQIGELAVYALDLQKPYIITTPSLQH